MTTQEVKTIIASGCQKYRVKFDDGTTKVVRLWISREGFPCIIDKGKRYSGHILNSGLTETDKWVSLVELKKTHKDYKKRILKRAKDARDMLDKSGLWVNIKQEIETFLALTDEELDKFVKDVENGLYYNCEKYPWLRTFQIFDSFLLDRCWKAPNYSRWWRAEKNLLQKAIENKGDYRSKWVEGYDNSVEVKMCEDGIYRGWYSEEYRNCGNGHYYLLFDATHAIFYEDD